MLAVFEVIGIVILFLVAVILLQKILKNSNFAEFFIYFIDYFSGETFTIVFLIFVIGFTIIFLGFVAYQIKLMQP
jgi:hypothetical protein